jgi:hypothetical protein
MNMAYELTNGFRTEESAATEYDELLSEARAWAACTGSDVKVIDKSDGQAYIHVNHFTGEVL